MDNPAYREEESRSPSFNHSGHRAPVQPCASLILHALFTYPHPAKPKNELLYYIILIPKNHQFHSYLPVQGLHGQIRVKAAAKVNLIKYQYQYVCIMHMLLHDWAMKHKVKP